MIKIEGNFSPLVIVQSETDKEDWKVISSLFNVPENAKRIEITYSKVEYFMEDEYES